MPIDDETNGFVPSSKRKKISNKQLLNGKADKCSHQYADSSHVEFARTMQKSDCRKAVSGSAQRGQHHGEDSIALEDQEQLEQVTDEAPNDDEQSKRREIGRARHHIARLRVRMSDNNALLLQEMEPKGLTKAVAIWPLDAQLGKDIEEMRHVIRSQAKCYTDMHTNTGIRDDLLRFFNEYEVKKKKRGKRWREKWAIIYTDALANKLKQL